MPTLLNTLQGHDLGFLKIVANSWGIEIKSPDSHAARPILIHEMLNRSLIEEIVESLPEEAKRAWKLLYETGGHILWAQFVREFGDVRVMGAARRERERPDINPATPVEILWYRALIGRAFLNLENEPQEYAYIPEEFMQLFIPVENQDLKKPGRPASPGEVKQTHFLGDTILDDACTLLAGFRIDMPAEKIKKSLQKIPFSFLETLLRSAGILDPMGTPEPEKTRFFLEEERSKALLVLFKAWVDSNSLDEIRLIPTITVDGQLENQPVITRHFLMEMVSTIPLNQWWNIESFVQFIFNTRPDFERPGGDYDSWFIKDAQTGEYLRGFANWDKIDGAIIRFMITGPLYWLGILELASPKNVSQPVAFRFSKIGEQLWDLQEPTNLADCQDKIEIDAHGIIRVPKKSPRAVRYQFSRFGDWDEVTKNHYQYKLTPHSLQRAAEQGLKISHFISLAQKYGHHAVSPNLRNALENWESNGIEVKMIETILLRVEKPQILSDLQKHPAGRFIREILTPTIATINTPGLSQVERALSELGYFTSYDVQIK